LHKLIKDTLTTLNVPVALMVYIGTVTPYITYQIYNEVGEAWGNNVEVLTNYYIQVNVFSKTDYTSLVSSLITAMLNAGFIRTSAMDLYEAENKLYHKVIRFSYGS
jgi:hypothetical protein